MPVTILLLAAVLFGNLITAGIIAPLASDGNKPRVSTNRDDFETMVYVHNGQNHSLVPASSVPSSPLIVSHDLTRT